MSLIVPALVQLALLVVGVKLYLWSRRSARAARTRWRRRMGSLLFFLPPLMWLGRLVLPELAHAPLDLVAAANERLDAGLAWAIGAAEDQLGGVWRLGVSPIVHVLFYSLAGVLVGWPLDRWRRVSAAAEDAESAEDAREA